MLILTSTLTNCGLCRSVSLLLQYSLLATFSSLTHHSLVITSYLTSHHWRSPLPTLCASLFLYHTHYSLVFHVAQHTTEPMLKAAQSHSPTHFWAWISLIRFQRCFQINLCYLHQWKSAHLMITSEQFHTCTSLHKMQHVD